MRKVKNQIASNPHFAELGSGDGCAGVPIDVRVSADAIVEVYGVSGAPENNDSWDASDLGDSAWTKSRGAREESQDAFAEYWRARRAQRAAAYIAFAALAAIAMWFAMR